ncbi:hypothetical protein DAEQUDRAFT_770933 [Daedalea quercina L-15889]|uniref:CCHC-type domain-containing protein n=1 Tax=Daedalea quercina L-15889 TaxID=1314783 RepID=A0A165KG43_9APHY|nr:hypothetical protein DAEQUDRAFT_770933 [Daedalea quercina L-15889]
MSSFAEPTDDPDYLEKSDDLATTGDKPEQTNKPELIAEASTLESESDSDSDSDNKMMTIAELQAQINCLSGSTKLDVPKLKGFQGKSDDVGPFIQQVEAYFNATGNGQTDPQQKINYAVLLIDSDSDANYWKDLHYLEEDVVQAQGQHQFDTWEEFKDAFRKAFPIYAEGDKALMTLTGVRQGRTPTMASVPKFRTLAAKAKFTNNAVLAALFKRAVHSDLPGKMLNLENPPSAMAGWYDLVLRLDLCQVYSRGYSGGGEQHSYQNTGRGSGQLNEPMDIDAMAPKECQRHQELGLCFYCHKQGHLFHQCPERDKKRKENPKRRQPSGPAYVQRLFKDLPIEDRAALFEQLSEDF